MKKLLLILCLAMAIQAQTTEAALKNVYANYFLLGSILSQTTMNSAATKSLVLKEFNSITPENELKPDATMKKDGSTDNDIKVDLSRAASILDFCEKNNIPVRGHTLVWHSQTPDWFFNQNLSDNGALADSATMNKRMKSYIKNMFAAIATQYPNLNLYAYDVVNEAFTNDGGGLRKADGDTGGNSKWTKIYGDDSFIQNAFKYAREFAPSTCKLYYNDYNEYMPAKTTDIYNLAMKIKAQGNIDGIGMQSHLGIDYPDVSTYTNAIKKFKETGLDIQVTELDLTISGNSTSNFTDQAKKYKDIMKAIIDNGGNAVKAVVVWGVRDDQSWRNDKYPLLFTGSGETITKKPAYDSLAKLIPQSEWGDGNNPGVPSGNFKLNVKASPIEGGKVTKTPDNASYASGSSVTISATANEGWAFVGWSGDVTGTEASTSVTVDKNKTATALFLPTSDGTTNIVQDGNFSGTSLSDSWKWNTGEYYGNSQGNSSVSGGKVTLTITNAGTDSYMPQLIQQGLALEAGMKYRLTFTASAGAARSLEVGFQQSADPWGTYIDSVFQLTTAEQEYEFEFVMSESDPNVQLSFNVGGTGMTNTSVTISNVKLIYLAADLTKIRNPISVAKFTVHSLGNRMLRIESNANTAIYLYDIKGNLAQKVQVSSGSNTVKLSVPSGIYVIKQAKNGQTQKVLVK